MKNIFEKNINGHKCFSNSVEDRLEDVRRCKSIDDLWDTLHLPGIQKTVGKAIRSKIKRFQKNAVLKPIPGYFYELFEFPRPYKLQQMNNNSEKSGWWDHPIKESLSGINYNYLEISVFLEKRTILGIEDVKHIRNKAANISHYADMLILKMNNSEKSLEEFEDKK